MIYDDCIDTLYEQVACPYCGHDAVFQHEEGVTMGVLSCKFCDEREEVEE